MSDIIKPDFEINEISSFDMRFLSALNPTDSISKAYKAGQKDMLSRVKGTAIFEQSILETTVKRLQEENEQLKANNEWISVKELPEDRFAAVLVFDANKPHYQQQVQQAYWFKQSKRFKIESTGISTNEVTHWKYLPNPPISELNK